MASIVARALMEARSRTPGVKVHPITTTFAGGGPYGAAHAVTQTKGREEQLNHFRGIVHSCVRTIAQRWAAAPLCLGRRTEEIEREEMRPKKESLPLSLKNTPTAQAQDIEIIERHEFLEAWKKPNDYMTSWALMYVTGCSLELNGVSFWFLDRKPSRGGKIRTKNPLQIWPLPASWVTPRFDDDGNREGWTITTSNTHERIEVDADEVVYFYYPDPADPSSALAPLQAAARSVVSDEAISEAQRRMFSNGIWPGMAVTIGRHPDMQGRPGERPVLSDAQRRQITNQIKLAYQGVMRNDEPIILDGMIESVTRMTPTSKEMDWLQSGNFTKNRICLAFGVNPIVMGEVENANRASATAAEDHFLSININPKLDLCGQILTVVLSDLYDDPDLLAWFEPARPIDPDQVNSEMATLFDRGGASFNEWRSRLSLAPLRPGLGDVCWVNPGMRPVPLTEDAAKEIEELKLDPVAQQEAMGGGMDLMSLFGGGGQPGAGAPGMPGLPGAAKPPGGDVKPEEAGARAVAGRPVARPIPQPGAKPTATPAALQALAGQTKKGAGRAAKASAAQKFRVVGSMDGRIRLLA